jgi:glycerol-3-phosphate acyltransferase PlsX
MKALAAGEVDAVVSAGDSRAVVAMAKHYVGLVGKVKRPILGVFVPITSEHSVLLVDAGAYTGLHAVPLVQAALVGEVYWSIEKGLSNPRIALLNIGREKFKGPVEVRRAAMILKGLPVNFVGFVEPQDLFSSPSSVDILVTNGFTGNLFLKLYESLSEHLLAEFESFMRTICRVESQGFEMWQERFERYRYERTGGVPLLGVKKPVVVAHGRSGSIAVCKAIEKAIGIVKKKFTERMEAGIESNPALKNVSVIYKSWAVSAFGGSKKGS